MYITCNIVARRGQYPTSMLSSATNDTGKQLSTVSAMRIRRFHVGYMVPIQSDVFLQAIRDNPLVAAMTSSDGMRLVEDSARLFNRSALIISSAILFVVVCC